MELGPKLLEYICKNAIQLAIALAIAWLLTWASRSILVNFILIVSAAVAVRTYLESHPDHPFQPGKRGKSRRNRSTPQEEPTPSASAADVPQVPPPQPSQKQLNRWREHVHSKVVEHAWETLCGSIVQEFIYDTWYNYLTPDREFPAEIRRILNHAFGQGAARARTLDLRVIMEDASELLMEQLELYRDTRESILAEKGAARHAFLSGDPNERERVLRERMALDGNLHPALLQSDGDYKMLRAVSEGLVGLLLDPADYSRAAVRAVARELLAGCVLRPLMMWCTPYHVNRGLYRLLGQQAKRGTLPAGAAPAMDAVKAKAMKGHWEFEQRIVKTKEAESSELKSISRPGSSRDMPPPPPRRRQHARSRSHDELSLAAMGAVKGSSLFASSMPPGAAPARFWSETQSKAGAEQPVRPQSAGAPVHAGHAELSGDSTISRSSSISCATSPMNLPAASAATAPLTREDLHHPSQTTVGTDEAGVTSSLLFRPSPFDGTESSASFTGTTGTMEAGEGADAAAGHLIAPSATASNVHESPMPRRSPAGALTGFLGLPRARVVAADLNSSGAKDFVVYKIRVGDDSGRDWTVSRRYRHFEVLHRQLRNTPIYRSKLPPKRIFIHTQNEEFVEYRRNALDVYLQEVLSSEILARSGDVWEFLRVGSERFEVPEGEDGGRKLSGSGDRSLKRNLSRAVISGATTVGRGVMEAAVDVTRGVTHGVHKGTNAAVDGVKEVGAVLSFRHRRSASVPEELAEFDPTVSPMLNRSARAGSKPDPLTRAGTALLRTTTASARKVKNVLLPSSSSQQLYENDSGDATARDLEFTAARGAGVNISGGSLGDESTGTSNRMREFLGSSASDSAENRQIRTSRSTSPLKQARRVQTARPPRGGSPITKLRRAETTGAVLGASRNAQLDMAARSAAFAPGFQPPRMAAPLNYEEAELDLTGLAEPGACVPPIEVDAFGASSPASAPADSPYYCDRASNGVHDDAPPLQRYDTATRLDFEASAGISAPLYEMVDCIFQLQTRGFFRRQVYAVARQMLSMAIGDAIDVFVLAKLRLLRQESTIGRVIQLIQTSLWPGGVWFQRTPQFIAAHPELAAAQDAQPSTPTARAGPMPGMQPEKFLDPVVPSPLDEEEIREAVRELLVRRMPTALVRLVGRNACAEGMEDLYEMIQSPAFMKQLGYGALEIVALHLCPELKGLFQSLDAVN